MTRERTTAELAERRFDLLVIGGGIVGAGIAAQAARSGLAVALVDKGDFGGGTSSASSKLVHGGLRYLRLGDVRLVREAHHERRALSNVVAPHLVRRTPFLAPRAAAPGRAGPRRPGPLRGRVRVGAHGRRRSRAADDGRLARPRRRGGQGQIRRRARRYARTGLSSGGGLSAATTSSPDGYPFATACREILGRRLSTSKGDLLCEQWVV